MIKNLVLAGAQLKGVAYIGVLKAMEELKIIDNIENILGVSSGSLFGLGMILGFKSCDLEHMILELALENLKDFQSDSVFNLFYTYGLDKGDKITKLTKVILRKKTGNEDISFKELNEKFPNKKLIIVGSNLSKNCVEYFSVDHTPDMPVHIAIRISTSFPLVFEKVEYNGSIYLDGGLLLNYPIEYFENRDETLGICTTTLNKNSEDISSFDKYIIKIIYLLSSQLERYISNKNSDRSIVLKLNYNVDSIDFSKDVKKYLIQSGYEQFMEQIKDKIDISSIDDNITENNSCTEEVLDVMDELIEIVSNDNSSINNIEKIVDDTQ